MWQFFQLYRPRQADPAGYPLRLIRDIANTALKTLSGEFGKLYSPIGRGSIPPERLMRAMLLQAFYSIRSERQLVERIDTDLLFRWFVGLGIEDAVWDATTFSKNGRRPTALDDRIYLQLSETANFLRQMQWREVPAAANRRAVEAQIRSLLSNPLRLGTRPSLTLYWL